jgi:CRP/FNR family transcriptional regulator, cyclic AMP receptor protein
VNSQNGYAGGELGAGRDPGALLRRHAGDLRAAHLLDLLPELGDRLGPGELAEARARSLVQVESFEPGEWTPHLTRRHAGPDTALLVAGGLLVREVEIGGRVFAELLGEGDLIYPWSPPTGASIPDGKWRALISGTLAVVDEALVGRIAPYPSLTLGLARLSTQRARFLAALAITRRLRRVEPRLLFLFALLAERWGRVTPDGVILPLPLGHELLARLIGTRRPSVTTALGRLRERSLVTQLPDGWLLAIDHTAPRLLLRTGEEPRR